MAIVPSYLQGVQPRSDDFHPFHDLMAHLIGHIDRGPLDPGGVNRSMVVAQGGYKLDMYCGKDVMTFLGWAEPWPLCQVTITILEGVQPRSDIFTRFMT